MLWLLCLTALVPSAEETAQVRRVLRLRSTPGVQVAGPYALLLDPETGRVFVLARGSSNLCAVGPGPDDISRPLPLHYAAEYGNTGYSPDARPRLVWGKGRETGRAVVPSGEELAGIARQGIVPTWRRALVVDHQHQRLLLVDWRSATVLVIEQ